MEIQTALSKTIGLQKVAFSNTLAIFSTLQQQGEDLLKTTLEQSPWLPVGSKNVCLFWADYYSKSLENMKSMADQGFAEIERMSSTAKTPEENKSQQTITKKQVAAPRSEKRRPSVKAKTVHVKKNVVTEALPSEKKIAEKVPVEKQVVQEVPAKNPVAHEKLESIKSEEVKAMTSMQKPTAISHQTAPLASREKESTGDPLQKKKG